MDLMKQVVSRVTWDAYLRRDGYSLGALRRKLNESQYETAARLQALQLDRLKALLKFAAENNEFYRRRFSELGFDPRDIVRLDDLNQLPVLTKDEIRESLSRRLSDGFDKDRTIAKRTGGSTGVPVHVWIDYEAGGWKKAAVERHNRWAGLEPGDRMAAVWGDTSAPMRPRERLRNALTARVVFLDTLKFDDESIDRFLAAVRRNRTPILMGHGHSLYRLALYVRDSGVWNVCFRGVISTAMGISDEERKVVEETFHTRVFDRYGCEELSIIASQCELVNGMHIFAEGLIVESIDQSERRPGKLVITDLLNYAMPLIRYEVGDYGVLSRESCPCGRGLPMLEKVAGREADFLYRTDGIPVFGISVLDTFAIHIPGIKQVQIRQETLGRLDFTVVPDREFGQTSLAVLRRQIDQVFGPEMEHTVRVAERVEQTASGKYRFSICNLSREEIERAKAVRSGRQNASKSSTGVDAIR